MDTLNIVLVSKDHSSLAGLSSALREDSTFHITQVDSSGEAMQFVKDNRVDVVVASDELRDKSGLQCITEIVAENPFINCALVSALYPAEFHEATEGLGIFMQLPVNPDGSAAKKMIGLLDRIYQLSEQ